MSTLTHHKKSVRAMAQHPKEYALIHVLSASRVVNNPGCVCYHAPVNYMLCSF